MIEEGWGWSDWVILQTGYMVYDESLTLATNPEKVNKV